MVESLAEKFRGRAKVVRIEAAAFDARLCARYGVVRFPMLGVFQDREMRDYILWGGTVGRVRRMTLGKGAEDLYGPVQRGDDLVSDMLEQFLI